MDLNIWFRSRSALLGAVGVPLAAAARAANAEVEPPLRGVPPGPTPDGPVDAVLLALVLLDLLEKEKRFEDDAGGVLA